MNFIPNIDDANARIAQLEAELAQRDHSRRPYVRAEHFVPNIDDANNQVHQLERELAAARPGAQPGAKLSGEPLKLVGLARAQAAAAGHKTYIAPPKELFGLQRAMAANAKQQQELAAKKA